MEQGKDPDNIRSSGAAPSGQPHHGLRADPNLNVRQYPFGAAGPPERSAGLRTESSASYIAPASRDPEDLAQAEIARIKQMARDDMHARDPDSQWVPAEHGTEKGALQKRVARGLTWTFIDAWGSQLIQLVIFALLANLLLPVDFGLVALAAVFVQFAQLFVDQGLGDALIQRKSITRLQIDTAFWVAVVTGAIFMLLGFVLALPISILVGQPALAPIIAVLSLTFLETSFSSVQMALLRRDMRFKSLAVRRLLAVAVGGAIGVAGAFLGWGAWALVANEIAYGTVSVVMLWTVSPWRPDFQWSRSDFRELFSFGANVVGSDVLNFISRNSDNFLIGAVLGVGPLGFYAVGYKILDTTQTLLVNAARKLAFPVFSRIQGDRERTRRAYERVNRSLGTIILPGYIGLALVAQEAIVVIFGNKWGPSGPVAATLYLIGPVLTLQVFSGALLNAAGHPEITFRFRLVTVFVHVTGFFIAVFFFKDIVAVAWAFVIGSYLLLPLNLYLQHRYAGISIFDHLWQLRWIAVSTAIMAAVVIAVRMTMFGNSRQDWLILLVEIPVGIVAYLAAMLVLERQLLKDTLSFAFQAIPGLDRFGPGGKGGGKGGKGGRKRNRTRADAEMLDAESREVDMGMDIVADMGVDEARTGQI